jgi:hypothetical protein
MELDLQSFFGLHVHSCAHWLTPLPPAFGLIYEGAIGQPRLTTLTTTEVTSSLFPMYNHGVHH